MEDEIRITANTYKTSINSKKNPVLLFTDAMDPCIGIALYIPSKQKGFLAHVDSAYIYDSKLEQAIDKFVNNEVEVWGFLGGGIIRKYHDSVDWQNQISSNRQKAEELISKNNIFIKKIKWGFTYLSLSLSEGVVSFEHDDDDEIGDSFI